MLYYKNATLLKNALSFFGQWVLQTSEIVRHIIIRQSSRTREPLIYWIQVTILMGLRPSWLSYQLSSLKVLKSVGKFKLPKWPNFHFEHLFNKRGTQSMIAVSYIPCFINYHSITDCINETEINVIVKIRQYFSRLKILPIISL